ncbi:MAG: hypothetical protein AABW53_00910 [Nanoarchaeota archaeon]
MNPKDILGNIDDLKKILDEAASSQTPIKQPRMIKEEPVRVTPKRDDGSDYGGDYDNGPEEAYSSDPLDPQPAGMPQPAYTPVNQPAPQFTSPNVSGFPPINQPQNGSSSVQLGQLLKDNLWGFALGILMNSYKQSVAEGYEEEARFIRTDVQRFVQQKGRHRFRPIPYDSIQDFIDECVSSDVILDDEEYLTEKSMREEYHKSGTVDALIRSANGYHEARANKGYSV